jgi:pimeloyl-ACP methyl ester carboxylesterase
LADPPTLIFLHGIGVEADMWKDAADPLNKGVLDGFRIVRPEAPWHSRRRRRGWYGGEPAIGMGPLGFLDLFQAWITEISVLIDWARRTSGGPVALGGVSLGALISQVAAVAAREWPAAARPDALILVATSGAIMEVVAGGSLSKAVNLQPQLESAGWSEILLARWLPLLEPQGPPAMPADKVVMVLGESDDLTPHPGGIALARDWAVPPENLFVRPQGHFSVSLGLLRDREPLNRLAEIM